MDTFLQPCLPFVAPRPRIPRRGCKDVFHASMVRTVSLDSRTGIPVMSQELGIPKALVSFSDAMYGKGTDRNSYVHFYEDDYKIERFWNNPMRYMGRLSEFAGFVSPDYSSTFDMPKPLRDYNRYRNFLVGAWLQSMGFKVLCNVRCSYYEQGASLSGIPRNSVLAVGATGCMKSRDDRRRFEGGIVKIVDELSPACLVVCGSDSYGVFDYAKRRSVDVRFFQGKTSRFFSEGSVR